MTNITDSIRYIGVDDKTLDLFESQYILEEGISYNSYLILDEKIAVMDTVDERMTAQWEENIKAALGDRTPDYVVISHMEPDHSGSLLRLMELFPDIKLVGNAKTFQFFGQFFDTDITGKTVVVAEGGELNLGAHTLKFMMAPMVHWPEVMVTFDMKDKVLFSADAFGKFGAFADNAKDDWACEARRYYFNIVGKYGNPVQTLLKKVSALGVTTICPLHGPVLSSELEYYIGKYDTWSSYKPEDKGVLVAYASIHGNTAKAAEEFGKLLEAAGAEKVVVSDLVRDDMAEVIEDAFRYDRMVLAAPSYDAGVFPAMQDFLAHLKSKTYQNRKVGIIENGSWAPSAARVMKAELETMKGITLAPTTVTIKSSLKEDSRKALEQLAKEMCE